MKLVNRSMKTCMLQRQLSMVTRKLENTFQLPTVERDFLMREKAKIQAILKERGIMDESAG